MCHQIDIESFKTQRLLAAEIYFEKTVTHMIKKTPFFSVAAVILTPDASTTMRNPLPDGTAVEELNTTSLPFWLIRLKGLFTQAAKFKPVSQRETG